MGIFALLIGYELPPLGFQQNSNLLTKLMPHIDATHNVLYTLVVDSNQKLRLITILTRNL
jgi:hypothetical protein